MTLWAQHNNWLKLQRLFRACKQTCNTEQACLQLHRALQHYPVVNVRLGFTQHTNIDKYVRTVMYDRVTELYNLYDGSYNDIPIAEITFKTLHLTF